MGIYGNAYCFKWLGREISCYGGKKTNMKQIKKGGRYIFRKKDKSKSYFHNKKRWKAVIEPDCCIHIAQGSWGRDGTELVPLWWANQILVHFHQLSETDRYFFGARQEIRLLSYSFFTELLSFSSPILQMFYQSKSLWPFIFPNLKYFFQSYFFPSVLEVFVLCVLLPWSCMDLRLICASKEFNNKINFNWVRWGHSQLSSVRKKKIIVILGTLLL